MLEGTVANEKPFVDRRQMPTASRFAILEEALAAVTLIGMALLPLLEVAIRKFYSAGIPGSTVLVQHLVLWTAFLGCMIGARRGELLALATADLMTGTVRNVARFFAGGVGFAVCWTLAYGSLHLVLVEREAGRLLVLGFPVWIAESIMPIGFAVTGYRLLTRSSDTWKGRLPAMLLLLVPVSLRWTEPGDWSLVAVVLAILVVAICLGAPIFVGLAGIAVLLTWNNFDPIAATSAEVYNLTVKPLLPTIPLFTLAGFILAEGEAPRRLVSLFRALFGWLPGGVAVVTILVCAFFTSFTGGSGVTILAMGGLLYPMLLQEKHGAKFSSGMLTSAGSLGLLLPPSLAVILFSVVSELEIRRLFVSGLLPAVVEMTLVAVFVLVHSRRSRIESVPFVPRDVLPALWRAKGEVALPLVVLVSIFTGLATLVETAAISVLYAFILEFVLRRRLRLGHDLLRVVAAAASLIGGVLIILGAAMGLTMYLVMAGVPELLVQWVQSFVQSPLAFLLLFNLLLLVIGCLMDIYSAITVVVPLAMPLGAAFGIDPYHLGIIFLVNLELGYLTPPVGMNLFLASYRFGRPLTEIYRSTLPFLLIRAVAVLLVTYVSVLTGWLPSVLPLNE
jgi:C4-dicarboxylate transporter, DctM subunit